MMCHECKLQFDELWMHKDKQQQEVLATFQVPGLTPAVLQELFSS